MARNTVPTSSQVLDWRALAMVFNTTMPHEADKPPKEIPSFVTWRNILETTIELFSGRYGQLFNENEFRLTAYYGV